MKKILSYIIIIMLLLLPLTTKAIATNADTYEALEVFIFAKDNCKECTEAKDYLNDYLEDKVNIKVTYLNNKDHKDTINTLKEKLNITQDKYPLIIIGSNYFIGYNDEVKEDLEKTITEYQKHNVYCNLVNKIQNNEDISACLEDNKDIIKQVEYEESNPPWFLIGAIVGFLVVFIGIIIYRKLKK